jgi:hypothetical protein
LGIVLLGGCGSTFNNDALLEDADFLNALPGPEQIHISTPGTLEVEACEEAGTSTLACLTVDSLDTAQSLLAIVNDLTQVIHGQTPTERGEDYRVWGPGDWLENLPGTFVRVEMSRSPTRSTYSWAYQFAPSSQGPWSGEILVGTHRAGELIVAEGSGDLDCDLEAWAQVTGGGTTGSMTIEYDVRDRTWLRLVTDGRAGEDPLGQDRDWTYEELPDGGGEFIYDSAFDVHNSEQDIAEQVDIRVRWTALGDGRGYGLVTGGDLEVGLASTSECWDPDGQFTWHTDEFGWQDEQGDVALCAFSEPAWPAVD